MLLLWWCSMRPDTYHDELARILRSSSWKHFFFSALLASIINWKAWLRSVSRMCVFLNCLDSVPELLLWLLHVRKQYDRTTSVRVTQCSAASHVSMNEIYVSILMCRQLRHNGKQH
jgi:hypothetical protein